MKDIKIIEQRLTNLIYNLDQKLKKHSCLDDIDLLSSYGSILRSDINRLKGQIISLDWVLSTDD